MDKAMLLASKAPHSSDWLYTLSITACGLRLSDEAIRVAVGLRLGLNICEPHPCPCGASVTSRGTHGLSCKRSSSRSTRQQHINDAILRALKRADISSTKEPAGLLRGDGKRPDGLSLVPWQSERSLTWDVTVVDTLVSSYTPTTSVNLVERRRQQQRGRELSSPKSPSAFIRNPGVGSGVGSPRQLNGSGLSPPKRN